MALASFVMMLICAPATADLQRGSEGEEVVSLQQQLIDIGALNDAADGKFGRKTEQAVKDMQVYWGMKKTGKAGEAFLEKLNLMWHTLNDEGRDGRNQEEELKGRLISCCPTDRENVFEFCPRHEIIPALQALLTNNGRKAPEGVRTVICGRIVEVAYRETVRMYDAWEKRLKSTEKSIARKYRQQFTDLYAEKSEDLLDYYRKTPLKAYTQLADWLVEELVQECYDLYGREPN